MGQKVNPHGLRVGVIKNWDSRWYASDEKFGDILVSDYNLREHLKNKLLSAGISKIEIERDAKETVKVFIHCAKPGMIIGKGGSVIQKIVAESGAKVDIDDDGTICIAAINGEQAAAAKAMIDAIVFEPEVGATYPATVVKILASKVNPNEDVGCFVEYAPGKEGMVHISKIADKRIDKVEDVLSLGDTVKVKYIGLDKKGRMDFSIKDAK